MRCTGCDNYVPPEVDYPHGLCDVLLDRNICACNNHRYVLKIGCPSGKFGPMERKETDNGEIQRGMPYSMRRKAIVPGENLRTVRL